MGNRNGRCWKESTSGRKGVPRLGVPTDKEGQTGRAVLSLMESQWSQSSGVSAP